LTTHTLSTTVALYFILINTIQGTAWVFCFDDDVNDPKQKKKRQQFARELQKEHWTELKSRVFVSSFFFCADEVLENVVEKVKRFDLDGSVFNCNGVLQTSSLKMTREQWRQHMIDQIVGRKPYDE
jgi:hypothetical protein